MHEDPKELPPQNPHESTDRPGDRDPQREATGSTTREAGSASGSLTRAPDETRAEEGTTSTERSTSPERVTTPPAAEEGSPSVTTPEPSRPETGTTGATATGTRTGTAGATATPERRPAAPGERAAPPRPVERGEDSSSHPGRWVAGAVAVAGAAAPIVYRTVTGHWPFQGSHAEPVHVRTTLTIQRPAREVYDFWRSLDQLPRFLRHLEEVETLDEKRSRWTARSPAGKSVSWEAEITEERPGELLAWRSVEGSEVETAGRVGFHGLEEGRGTRMEVDLRLAPPGGRAGKAVANLLEPATERQVREDLRRFKNLMEAGEVPATREQPNRPGQAAATTPVQ